MPPIDISQDFIVNVQQQPVIQCSTGVLDFSSGYSIGGTDIINPLSCALECDSMPRSSTSYYQASAPIGLEDFTLSFKVNASYLEQHQDAGMGGGHFSLLFANLVTTTNQQASADANGGAGDGIIFSYRAYNFNDEHLMQLRSRYNGTENYTEANLPTGFTYNVTINRTALQLIMTVRDEAGNLLFINDGLGSNPSPRPDNTDINYFVPMCGRGDTVVTDEIASAIIWDYQLTYQAGPEDFQTYEGYPSADPALTVTANKIQFTGLRRDSVAYLRKYPYEDYGDFLLRFKMTITSADNNNSADGAIGGQVTFAGLTRNSTSTTQNLQRYQYGNSDGISLFFYRYTNTVSPPSYSNLIYLRDNRYSWGTEGVNYDGYNIPTIPCTYYVEMGRINNGTSYYADLYTNANYTGSPGADTQETSTMLLKTLM